GVIVGIQRFDLSVALDVGAALLRAALVLGVVVTGGGLIELGSVQLVSWIAAGFATAWVGLRSYPDLRLRPQWSGPHVRQICSCGGFAFAAQLSTTLVDRAGVMVVGAFLPMVSVTIFAIASGLVDYGRALAGGIRTTLPPLASSLEALGQTEGLRDLISRSARYCTMLVLPMAVAFVVRGASFISLWLGHQYGGPSGVRI